MSLRCVVIYVETRLGELKCERPDGLFAIDILRTAEDAPEVSKLEAGELHLNEVLRFLIAKEGVGGRVVAADLVEGLECGRETVISLDDDSRRGCTSLLAGPGCGAKDSVFFRGVFDDGDVAFAVGNEEVFRDGARDFGEGS